MLKPTPVSVVSGGIWHLGTLLDTTQTQGPSRAAAFLAGGRFRERRARRISAGGLATWSEAFHLSALLVGLGIGLVLVGIALNPNASFS
jgi:hypothetical protein